MNIRIIDFFHACQELDLNIVVFNEICINGGSKELWTQLYNRFAFLLNSGNTHLVQGMIKQLTDISDNIHIPPQSLPHCEFCTSLQGFHAPVEYSLLQRKPNPKTNSFESILRAKLDTFSSGPCSVEDL